MEPSKLSKQFSELEVENSGSDYLSDNESEEEVISGNSSHSEEYIEANSIEINKKKCSQKSKHLR